MTTAGQRYRETYDRFMNHTMPRREEHGSAVAAAAREGDELALQVMVGYTKLCSSFDADAAIELEAALDRWLAQTNERGPESEDSQESPNNSGSP